MDGVAFSRERERVGAPETAHSSRSRLFCRGRVFSARRQQLRFRAVLLHSGIRGLRDGRILPLYVFNGALRACLGRASFLHRNHFGLRHVLFFAYGGKIPPSDGNFPYGTRGGAGLLFHVHHVAAAHFPFPHAGRQIRHLSLKKGRIIYVKSRSVYPRRILTSLSFYNIISTAL